MSVVFNSKDSPTLRIPESNTSLGLAAKPSTVPDVNEWELPSSVFVIVITWPTSTVSVFGV